MNESKAMELADQIDSGELVLIFCHPEGKFAPLEATEEQCNLVAAALRRPSPPQAEAGKVDIRNFSISAKDRRCLEVWFGSDVTNADRAWLLEAINEKNARSPAPQADVRAAFRNADEQDWRHLLRFLPDTGHGRFWRAVFEEVRAALSAPLSVGEPVAWVNGDELDNMLDDRIAVISGQKSGGRQTPLYAAPPPPVALDAWQPIETAPKNAKEVLLLVRRGGQGWPTMRAVVGHWADGGGDEQPRFRGWFYDTGYGYAELREPTHWAPLNPPIPERGGAIACPQSDEGSGG